MKRLLDKSSILGKFHNFWIIYESLANFNYWWNISSVALIVLVLKIFNEFKYNKKFLNNKNFYCKFKETCKLQVSLIFFYKKINLKESILVKSKLQNTKLMLQKKFYQKDVILLNDIFLIYEEMLKKIDYIYKMYKIGTISKRYWTKKKIFIKYSEKKYYSSNLKYKGIVNDNDIYNNHNKRLIIAVEMKYKDNQNLLFTQALNKIEVNNESTIIKGVNKIKLEINDYVKENMPKIEKGVNDNFTNQEGDKIIKIYKDYIDNKIFNFKLRPNIIGFIGYNYTTNAINSTKIVLSNKIIKGYLQKGIGLHNKNVLLGQIWSDKDFIQVFTYIMENFEDDLNQKRIIEKNTEIKDLDMFYNVQSEKILKQIGVNDIIFNNNIKTKQELLQFLYKNWEKIRD